MATSNQVILNKRLFKSIVKNDVKDVHRLVGLGADVNSEFTIDELINNKLIDDNAIATIKNAEITIDELIKDRNVSNIPVDDNDLLVEAIKDGGSPVHVYNIDDNDITAIKNNPCYKIIYLPILVNKIILSAESKLCPLQLAVLYGWKETIIELIKKGANPNKALDVQGITILQLMCTAAVFRDKQCYVFDEDVVQLLFDHGADPNIQDIGGKTALYYLARSCDLHIAERITLMRNGSYPGNVHDNRVTRRIEKYLINGANPNIKANYLCCTILYKIVEYDSYLEEEPNLTNLLLDQGCTYATYEDVLKQPDVISMMQEEYGCNFGFADAKKQVDEFNSRHKQHIEKNDYLIKAINSKDEPKVDKLLSRGVSPNIRDNNGISILHLAVKSGDYSLTKLLLDKGANPNIKGWKNGTTPIFNAVISDRIDIAELLLKHAANPSVINTKGLSSLYFSVTTNNQEMTKLLLKYKANPDISHQVSVLFDVLNGIKDDNNMKIIENTLEKIKNIIKFLKSKDLSIEYSLFYKSLDIAEKNDKKNTAKRIEKLLDELTYPTSQMQDLNLHQYSRGKCSARIQGLINTMELN